MKKIYTFPLDLLILLIWTMISLIAVLIPSLNETFIIFVLSIPVFIFIPGYLLMAVSFPKSDQLEGIERFSLSIALSILLSLIAGLILDFDFKSRLLLILLVLCLLSLILIIIAIYRISNITREERFSGLIDKIYENSFDASSGSRSRIDIFLKIILIFSILSGILVTFYIIITPVTGDKFTEFYILGPKGKAEDYPSELKVDNPVNIKVGVVNHEYADVNYTIEVALDKEILNQTRFSLNHNETWENYINFVPDKRGNKMKLEFWLFKGDDLTSPYRDLHTWVNVK